MSLRHVAVIDIGKTNAKVVLLDLETLRELAVRRAANRVLTDAPYPHYDEAALWSFVVESLAALNSQRPVDAISVTAHGAAIALIGADGQLAMPILDYEHPGPETVRAAYEAIRPDFAETGSPRLPAGLNVGNQLFWLQQVSASGFGDVRQILTYPQYWSYRLSGVATTEVTSLGNAYGPLESRAKGLFLPG